MFGFGVWLRVSDALIRSTHTRSCRLPSGTLFCYMVVLGVFHGLCVLPVLLSIVNPASISSLIKAPKNHGNSRP